MARRSMSVLDKWLKTLVGIEPTVYYSPDIQFMLRQPLSLSMQTLPESLRLESQTRTVLAPLLLDLHGHQHVV